MIKKDIDVLIDLCHKELVARGYQECNVRYNDKFWNEFAEWMRGQSIKEFNRQVAERYCREVLKTTLFPLEWGKFSTKQVKTARALRKLVTFQEAGCFSWGAPRKVKAIEGPMAQEARQFLSFCADERKIKPRTLNAKRKVLCDFCNYANENAIGLDSLDYKPLVAFITDGALPVSTKKDRSLVLRQFLKFHYDTGKIPKDFSFLLRW